MEAISKLLIANRGEIAVRVIRAAHDAGINTVAIYADQDRNARFVRLAHEAYALNGKTSQETYLVPEKILSIAKRSGANAIHPGYGFLSENADFAQMVIDAGLIWVGPPPSAIRSLGDKVSARHIAQKVGAPLAPGTPDPVSSSDEVMAFATKHGVPVAIKAAHGGGGRGLKVAYTLEEIPEQFDSATREALAAFGRGECFVEKYLEKPRHVETQCLADTLGNVVVVSTRDCSLQRRHQKLVEEAPAPFLTDEQRTLLYESSKAILKEAGYVGAGTCEFLIGKDGTISFLEVNTRLQVEHPVSEEVTGIDLVREQFRIAEGGDIDYSDPAIRGHSIEFRINGEDAGRGFLPTPGPIHSVRFPGGPGVRVDSGITTGDIITGSFDSLLAKLIVTGATRKDALEKARRALTEFEITGLPTVIPFHRAVVEEPAFCAEASADFSVHTRWIETEFETAIEPWDGAIEEGFDAEELYRTVVVEVEGRRLKVGVPAGIFAAGERATMGKAPKRAVTGTSISGASEGRVTSPMQATVVKVLVEAGTSVVAGDLICVLEAMKMEQPITAPIDGTVESVGVSAGDSISGGHLLAVIA
ncbi:ATP-grasp domain-containing protein [Pontimonas sp.]|nr:ATP-grasp domain-containing protein [Pontimonas sp.]